MEGSQIHPQQHLLDGDFPQMEPSPPPNISISLHINQSQPSSMADLSSSSQLQLSLSPLVRSRPLSLSLSHFLPLDLNWISRASLPDGGNPGNRASPSWALLSRSPPFRFRRLPKIWIRTAPARKAQLSSPQFLSQGHLPAVKRDFSLPPSWISLQCPGDDHGIPGISSDSSPRQSLLISDSPPSATSLNLEGFRPQGRGISISVILGFCWLLLPLHRRTGG